MIVHSLDHLARNFDDLLAIIKKLNQKALKKLRNKEDTKGESASDKKQIKELSFMLDEKNSSLENDRQMTLASVAKYFGAYLPTTNRCVKKIKTK